MDESLELTIGEVARRAGIAASAVRYYESIGLLPEPQRLHGQRRYGTDVIGKLAFVDVAQNAGFKLEEIKELMRGAGGEAGMAAPLRQLSARKLDEVEALLERARTTKQWLEVANTCTCGSPDECTLFHPPGEPATGDFLRVVHVHGGGCRREPPTD
jgi:MerR family transcriptional regulator, redox-sensitive transcriptional activator SoxR